MKSTLKVIVTLLLLGISSVYAQSVDESEATPFHISSRGSAFGVQGEFAGTYRVSDSSIEVYVSKATLYVSEHCPYQGRRRINYITLGLWNQEASQSRLANRAEALHLYVVMSPREEHVMSDLRFSLPMDSTVDLAKRLLVVEIQEDTLDGPAQSGKGYAYVHSCPDIFVKKPHSATDQKTTCKK